MTKTIIGLTLVCLVQGIAVSDPTSRTLTGSNTNNFMECLPRLGDLAQCEDFWSLGSCCQALKKYIKKGCSCNPALEVLLGDQAVLLGTVLPTTCRIIQPWSWFWVPWYGQSSSICPKYITHDYGCPNMNDNEVDAARLQVVTGVGSLFGDTEDKDKCFDTEELIDGLASYSEPDVVANVPYGVGTYKGYEGIAEYFGIGFAGLNHGFWKPSFVPNTRIAGNNLEKSADGKIWKQATGFSGTFHNDNIVYTDFIIGQVTEFKGCSLKQSVINIDANEGLANWATTWTHIANNHDRYGAVDVCKTHEKFCRPAGVAQYDNYTDCLTSIRALPPYSQQCGPNRPLSGNSLTCKWKHHWMVPTNPALHCPHMGKEGTADPNGDFKCDDVTECSDDLPAEWVPLTNIDQPSVEFLAEAQTSNNQMSLLSDEEWEYGCALDRT